MKIPRPTSPVVLLMIIKKVSGSRSRLARIFPVHLALLFCSLLGLFVFMADWERVVRAAPITETLWGVAQQCDFEILDPQNSIAGIGERFDDETASCTGAFANDQKTWQYSAFQTTSLASIDKVTLEIRFYMAGLVDDHLELAVFDGNRWQVFQNYVSKKKGPPTALDTLVIDLSTFLDSPDKVNQAAVRLMGKKKQGELDVVTIFLDGARFIVNGVIQPTTTPTATALPTASPTVTSSPTLIPTFPALSITPTPHETPAAPAITPESPVSGNQQTLWGIEQQCGYELTDPEMGLDQQFNDQSASCTGSFAADKEVWRFGAFQSTSLIQVNKTQLEVRFSMIGLADGHLNLEISDGQAWQVLQRFKGKTGTLPSGLITMVYDVSNFLNSPEKINQLSVRFIGEKDLFQPDLITLAVDEMRLVVMSGPEMTASPTATNMPIFTPSSSANPPLTSATPTATVIPRPSERTVPVATPALLLNAAAAPRLAGDPHGDNSGMTDSCAACHTSHAADGIELRQSWPEESVCYSCHSSGGSGTAVEPAFSSYTNSQTGFFKHAVSQANGLHRLDQSSGADFDGGNRHIECEDCHEPHYAARGETNPPVLQLEMAGVSGVAPIWTGPGAPVSYTWLEEAEREHQVCFKCHSSFTTLPDYSPDGWNGSSYVANGLPKLTTLNQGQVPDQRDLAQAFNPNQASFHPVLTVGRNQNIAANTFVAGWSQSSMVYCTDCHDNSNSPTQGEGPHGSPLLHILKGQANYSTIVQDPSPRVSDQEVCFICHSYQAYVTGEIETSNFKEHKKHMNENWGTTCYTCHNSHGSEQLHLINFDASVVTFPNGTDSQSAWYAATANGKAGCNLICHGDEHNPEEYGP